MEWTHNNLTEIKIRVTPEQSKMVQKFLFSKGFSWDDNVPKIRLTKCSFLYTSTNSISVGKTEEFFLKDSNKEITFEQLISWKSIIETI